MRLAADQQTTGERWLITARFIEAVRDARAGDRDAGARAEAILAVTPHKDLAVTAARLAAAVTDATEQALAGGGPEPGWLLRELAESIAAAETQD